MTTMSWWAPTSPNSGISLTLGVSACLWWFLAFLEHLLPHRAIPTHPCAHPCLSCLHLWPNMPHSYSHCHLWLFGMIRKLIGPPRGVWGLNHELTLVCIQMASKTSWFFHIVLYTWSKHIYMLEIHNNIYYWLHLCILFSLFQLFCAYFVSNIELWEYTWLLYPTVN